MQQGFTPGDSNNGRACFRIRIQTFLHGHALVENSGGIVNFTTASTGQIAAEKRFKHQNQRITLAPGDVLFDDITADPDGLHYRYGHKPPLRRM
ncbi:hypothetical protein Abol_074_008 [Acetobacter orleanensis JCM 7639]|nr:hypothetical protein Abol_074_008 [Acetobacter orleanensis JCM 7639]